MDYGLLYQTRYPVLRKACRRLLEQGREDFFRFCAAEEDWLEDYALFMALKDKHGGVSWFDWEPELRLREPAALNKAKKNWRWSALFGRRSNISSSVSGRP